MPRPEAPEIVQLVDKARAAREQAPTNYLDKLTAEERSNLQVAADLNRLSIEDYLNWSDRTYRPPPADTA